MDEEYICLNSENEYKEDELYCCPKCGEFLCPICGGEVQTVQEYEEAMKANKE